MISVKNVTKSFIHEQQETCAIHDVSLEIKKEEIHGLIGESGAGKSTLLRMMNLLERPDSGEIHINGQVLTSMSQRGIRQMRGSIGMIFQHYHLVLNQTVENNVETPLILAGYPKKHRKDRVRECLRYVGLLDKAGQYPSSLSGGQKQRVAIARALATKPAILLCDEPTSALDRKSSENILDLLEKVNKEMAVTIVLVSHDLHIVKSICHRVSILDKGRLLDTVDITPRRVELPKGNPGWFKKQLLKG